MNRMKKGMKRLTAALLAVIVLTGTVPEDALTLVKAEEEQAEPAVKVQVVFKGTVFEKSEDGNIPHQNANVQIEFWTEEALMLIRRDSGKARVPGRQMKTEHISLNK